MIVFIVLKFFKCKLIGFELIVYLLGKVICVELVCVKSGFIIIMEVCIL